MSADFVTVRKGKGRIHLAVRLAPGEPVETLCAKHFGPGVMEAIDRAADCQACLRRLADPGRVSNAYFEGGRGSALLELSLKQARERGPVASEGRQPPTQPSEPGSGTVPRGAPRLTIVPSGRPERQRRGDPAEARSAPAQRVQPAEPAPKTLPPGVYRTPAGVVVRVGGPIERPRLERRQGARVRMIAGDVELDVPPLV